MNVTPVVARLAAMLQSWFGFDVLMTSSHRNCNQLHSCQRIQTRQLCLLYVPYRPEREKAMLVVYRGHSLREGQWSGTLPESLEF